jgi:hypothetical protein
MGKITNKVYEGICSFAVSKLLQEKRFRPVDDFYDRIETPCYFMNANGERKVDSDLPFLSNEDITNLIKIPMPTHALAVEWIRINFNIWIHPTYSRNKNLFTFIIEGTGLEKDRFLDEYFKSPELATEAALLYVLTEII